MNLQNLYNEITNDPTAIGYKTGATWKGDGVIAGLLNTVIVGNTITRFNILPMEVINSIVLSELPQLSTDERWILDNLLSGGTVDATNSNTFSTLSTIFSNASMPLSRALLLAKIQRDGSRAEKLWGEGTVISNGDVGQSANLGV